MNKFEKHLRVLPWFMTLIMGTLAAGCGGGDGGRDPILGTGAGVVFAAPVGAIVPGAVCPAAGLTIPTVTGTDPTSGNQFVTTSTNGVTNSGKMITANFSLAMDSATINATSFSLAPVGGALLIPASVSYNATTKVATLTTASSLLANTSYTAVIQSTAKSAAGTSIGCAFAWTFKTVVVAAAGLAPVNLGLAAPFGIAATAGVTNTTTAPLTTINGDVVLHPVAGAICNTVPVDAAGGFGLCGSNASTPIIHGTVISPYYPDRGATSGAVKDALLAAYLSITPLAGPPAAGSLGGATSIPAGTTLGALTGSALVPGDNLFMPGAYRSITSILITDDLTLDAQGNPDAIFVFQSSETLGTADGSVGTHPRILLVNGAKASNVYWQVGTSATLGTNAEWQGNILAAASITMKTGASSCGRLLAGAFTAGAFVFDSNVVSVPGNVNAPASCQ